MPRMVRSTEGTAMSGMRLTFPDLGFEVEIAGAKRPGMPPRRIAVTRPVDRLGSLTRRRFPTIEALVAAVREHCTTQAA